MDPVALLRKIVSIPSKSHEESGVADFLCGLFTEEGFSFERISNNIILHSNKNKGGRPHLMLCTHIDTVKEGDGYTFDPFNPPVMEDRVLGLGSNDAGGSVVAMYQAFKDFQSKDLPFDISLVYSAEEECSGPDGIACLQDAIAQKYDFAIIGEPTAMKGATAEKGLIVIDAEAVGVAGHAARNEGVNAIDIAISDIAVLKTLDIKATVTQINAGVQHNVIPDSCKWVIDIRTAGNYTNCEIMEMLQSKLKSRLKARSLTNKCSVTPSGHILIKALEECGIEQYISPTTSDWMKLPIPAIKIGPGESARSHHADEFILVKEIEDGIAKYSQIINALAKLV